METFHLAALRFEFRTSIALRTCGGVPFPSDVRLPTSRTETSRHTNNILRQILIATFSLIVLLQFRQNYSTGQDIRVNAVKPSRRDAVLLAL
jgi:hypothetical protein